jgi:hypothetical protein
MYKYIDMKAYTDIESGHGLLDMDTNIKNMYKVRDM